MVTMKRGTPELQLVDFDYQLQAKGFNFECLTQRRNGFFTHVVSQVSGENFFGDRASKQFVLRKVAVFSPQVISRLREIALLPLRI